MARTTISIDIARPPTDVFAYMVDMSNMTTWTNMKRMDLDGPPQAGTTGSFDMPVMGTRTFPFVMTAYEPGRSYGLRTTDRLNMEFLYTLSDSAGGTHLEQLIDAQPKGILRPLAPLVVRMMRAEEMGELRRLKAALEARPGSD